MSAPSLPAPQRTDAAARAASEKPTSELEGEARALLAAWQAAQNAGDFAAYERLYGQRFTGVKRAGPRTRNFDRKGWLEDRKRMFEKPMQVDLALQSLNLQGGAVTVLGTQSFRMTGYQDRGQKQFTLAREGGALRIVREEMLASELGPPPSISARMVVDVPEGPVLVILGRAPEALAAGKHVSTHAGAPAAVLEEASLEQAPAEASVFLAGDVQLVGPEGVCTTRAKALRIAHVAYAHFGQVMTWRGENPDLPKPDAAQIEREIRELDPQGFWAVELASRCVKEPLVALPGNAPIELYARSEVPTAQNELSARFAKLPFLRGMSRDEREQSLSDLKLSRFASGTHALVSAEAFSECSAPVLQALFDLDRGGRVAFSVDQGTPEHVEAVADLDGDGQPEVITRSAIGADRAAIVDLSGKTRLLLKLPYFDCPC
ncbi:MAG: DUF4440 domain-containing protein [Myxococcales bacterium]